MIDKILIDRSVIEQALEAFEIHARQYPHMVKGYTLDAEEALRAALEQQQDHSEQRLDMVPTGWKLVPVEPTSEMIAAGKESMQYSIAELPAFTCYNAMLRAAPQPPALEQPQVEQQPYLWHDPVQDQFWNREDAQYMDMSGTIPLYTHPQPPRQPLTDEQIHEVWGDMQGYSYVSFAHAIERAHGIGGKA